MCMEYLTRCMGSLSGDKDFGYHPKCKRKKIITFLFADDLLVFSRGDVASMRAIKGQLQVYCQM